MSLILLSILLLHFSNNHKPGLKGCDLQIVRKLFSERTQTSHEIFKTSLEESLNDVYTREKNTYLYWLESVLV